MYQHVGKFFTVVVSSECASNLFFHPLVKNITTMRKPKTKVSKSTISWTGRKHLTLGLSILMSLIWFGIIAMTYTSIWEHSKTRQAHHHGHDLLRLSKSNSLRQKIIKNTNAIVRNQTKFPIDSSWYGWQPMIPKELDCSWRKCFVDQHNCPKTCREDEQSWGSPPLTSSSSIADAMPDVTMLHRMYQEGKDSRGDPWPPSLSEELCKPMGVHGGMNDENKELFDAVPVQAVTGSTYITTKVMCMVYTLETAHATRIRAIRETWAGMCDGFLAFSNQTDLRIPAISIPHDGVESYGNMWQKVRSIWNFVGTYYIHDFDYFLLGGDDLFVIPTNLRQYLSTLQGTPDDPHFVGRRFKGYGNRNYFNSGGAGYVLSRGTLRTFVQDIYSHCHVASVTSMEDVLMAECLRTSSGKIGLTDTRDSMGRERFHPFSPGTHLTWEPPKAGSSDWYADYNEEWGIQLGSKCCAPDSVSFHYIKRPAMVRHLFSLLYRCKK
jgi:glycoprotein-N-acetylgalactosamine 3-beta-galactosyltransferase